MSRLDIDETTKDFIREHRMARLATADLDGQPTVIPICYAFDDEHIYTPIDEKPKRVEAGSLKRVRNIQSNPRVAIVIDDYSEDWSKLVYVLVIGTAEVISPDEDAAEHKRAVELLRQKYAQYQSMAIDQRPMIRITPTRLKRWAPAEKGDQA
jgi:PPOX class probable F420-dependent enzyme